MEVKKAPQKDLQRSRPQFLAIGMVISLSLAITAFEWRTEQTGIDILDGTGEVWEEDPVFITKIPPPPKPPKPKIIAPVVVETTEEVEPPKEIVFDLDILEPDDEVTIFEPEDEEVEEIMDIVEEMPTPIGGMADFYKFLSKKTKYPKQARRMGIEGKVYVQFVVDTDGSITDLQVAKGIGAGCDEEALRVLKLVPKWNPGKQRGRPVKVRMMVPIFFQLSR